MHSTKWIFEYFGLNFTSILKVRGKVYEAEKWNKKIKIIPTLHPAAVLYNANWKDIFEKDFEIIAKEISNLKILQQYILSSYLSKLC
jgi:DNA polymerase